MSEVRVGSSEVRVTATDELRRLLDERDIETDHGSPVIWKCANGHGACARDYDGALTVQTVMTPQQAIDATLGRGTCRNISPKLGNDEFTCEECLARVYGSGGQWFDANWEYHKFNYCPNCGRKVVDE